MADDTTLTPYGGSVVVGELVRRLGLVGELDRAIDAVARARPFKERRGASAGELLVALAESMLVGGDAFHDLQDLRADHAAFYPRKANMIATFRIPRGEEVGALIDASGVESLEYDKRWGQYRVRLTSKDVAEHRDLLLELIRRASGNPAPDE